MRTDTENKEQATTKARWTHDNLMRLSIQQIEEQLSSDELADVLAALDQEYAAQAARWREANLALIAARRAHDVACARLFAALPPLKPALGDGVLPAMRPGMVFARAMTPEMEAEDRKLKVVRDARRAIEIDRRELAQRIGVLRHVSTRIVRRREAKESAPPVRAERGAGIVAIGLGRLFGQGG